MKYFLPLFLISLFITSSIVNAQEISSWKGFTRHDLQYEMRDVRVIIPNKALPGKPWVWRARFPDYHTEIDSILLSEGFHVVFFNTNNQFGSPNAVASWDSFYRFITYKYHLQQKASFHCHSRGGLFVYNWAKKNPDKVACIYADAIVCDIKSWPKGFGTSKGSSYAWETLKIEYQFYSDEEAMAFSDNPIDNLDDLAKAKVPILHTIGLTDSVVPPDENTLLLVNRYIKLGGPATVIPITDGTHQSEGHHYTIENPKAIIDFIKYHSINNGPLLSSNYHNIRGNLNNSQYKFENNKKVRVAFLGGSITHNPGWRDSIYVYLKHRFPNTTFDFVAAGMPSMGTTPAAFRLDRDVLSRGKIDLLFEEAAVNDAVNNRSNIEQTRALEGIIRKLRNSNPEMDIVMLHFADPEKIDLYKRKKEPVVITNHEKIANYYDISTLNLAQEVSERIDNSEFTWENDFRDIHPSPFGQGIYAQSIIEFLDNAYSKPLTNHFEEVAYELPPPIDINCYENGKLLDISKAKYSKGWFVDPSWNPDDGKQVRANYINVPMLIGDIPGNSLVYNFEGNTIGIAVAAGHDAGMIDFRIDNGKWQQINLYTKWSNDIHLPWYYTLAAGLENKKHVLELKISPTKDERSNGTACRIRYFYVNQMK